MGCSIRSSRGDTRELRSPRFAFKGVLMVLTVIVRRVSAEAIFLMNDHKQ
jgi:hypothetical protein